MHRVSLPDGQWAEIRDREELTVKGRRGIQSIAAALGDVMPKLQQADAQTDLSSLGLSEEQTDTVMRLQEATIVALLAAWSLPDPLPTLASVGDLPVSLFDALSVATAALGAETASGAITLDMSPGDTPDPKDRSGSFENSDGLSRDATVRTLTPKPPNGGAASATGS